MANEELVQQQNESQEDKELDQLLENAEKPAEEDFLAAFYEKHGRTLQALINQLGKNALKRIIIYTYMGEFSPKAYQPKNKIEADAAFQFNEGVFKRVLLRMEQEYKAIEAAELKEKQDLEEIEKLNQEAMTPEAKAEMQRLEQDAKASEGNNNG